jgi:glutamate-1-semialdehyde 2,1-aminomutase
MTAQSLAERARTVIPGGVNSGQRQVPGLTDLVIAASSGAHFVDQSGRRYTDYHAAFGPPLLGFHDPDVDAALFAAMSGPDLPGVAVTAGEVELAEELVRLVPGIEKVLLTSTGSEATFHALRLSRAATGRRLVVKFQGCYHGWHDAVSLNVISAPERVGHKDPTSKGILPEVLDSTLVLPFNDSAAVRRAFADHGEEIAAVILEPVPHNIGCVLPDDEFLRCLREETRRAGSVLIFDEVITGFRHAMGGWQSLSGVTPDLTTLGKALGNGYPIAALGGGADLMEQFSTTPGAPVFFAGTYNGHPAMVAAALATLKKLQSEPVHEHVFRLGHRVREGLKEVFAELDVAAVPCGFGSVFVTYFYRGEPPRDYADLLANDVALFVGYRRRLVQDHGIFEIPLNLKRSHVSYAHTDTDIDALLEATRIAVRDTIHAGKVSELPLSSTMGGVS